MFDVTHLVLTGAVSVALTIAVPTAPPEIDPVSTATTIDGSTCVLHRIGTLCVRLDDLNNPGGRR